MSEVDEAIVEIKAAIEALVPELEGLRDYARLNLKPGTAVEIQSATQDYMRRGQLLEASLEALESLVGDGYPDLAVREIAAASYQDLVDQQTTLNAALDKFASNSATSLNPVVGAPEPK